MRIILDTIKDYVIMKSLEELYNNPTKYKLSGKQYSQIDGLLYKVRKHTNDNIGRNGTEFK